MSNPMQDVNSLFDLEMSKPVEDDSDLLEDRMKLKALGADYMDLDEFGEE